MNKPFFSSPEANESGAGTVKLDDGYSTLATFSIAEACALRNQLEAAIDFARQNSPDAEDDEQGYYIKWEYDVDSTDAMTPEDAAREAWDALTREGSIAHVFSVTGQRGTVQVDLDELGLEG